MEETLMVQRRWRTRWRAWKISQEEMLNNWDYFRKKMNGRQKNKGYEALNGPEEVGQECRVLRSCVSRQHRFLGCNWAMEPTAQQAGVSGASAKASPACQAGICSTQTSHLMLCGCGSQIWLVGLIFFFKELDVCIRSLPWCCLSLLSQWPPCCP